MNINQPMNNLGDKKISAMDFINRNCGIPVPMISALNMSEIGEATLLGFDVEPGAFEGTGKIELNQYGPRILMPNRTLKEKNIHKIYGSEVMTEKNKVVVTEFGNDAELFEATANIANTTQGTFKSVKGLIAGDKVLVVKTTKESSAVKAIVTITDVDTSSKEITFDTNVTMNKGDYIRYINSAQGGCMDNKKHSTNMLDASGRTFTYYTQFFSRKVDVNVADLNQYFRPGSQQFDFFTYQYFGRPAEEIYQQVARQLRYGSGVGGATSEIKGYNTIIEERHAENLESIIDFSSENTAEKLQKKLEEVLNRVYNAPVQSEFILIANHKFLESYKNMMRKLYSDAEARACCNLSTTLHKGIMEWKIDDAPMVKHYLSQALSWEVRDSGIAYILPKDLIAGFTPPYLQATLSEGQNSKFQTVEGKPNMFGTIMTHEKKNESYPECKVYEHYTRLGFLYAGVSFRDTYFRLDNFNFGI